MGGVCSGRPGPLYLLLQPSRLTTSGLKKGNAFCENMMYTIVYKVSQSADLLFQDRTELAIPYEGTIRNYKRKFNPDMPAH